MKIIDLLEENKSKPIELISCLQTRKDNAENYFFYNGEYRIPIEFDKVTRVSKFNDLDLIVCSSTNPQKQDIVFLGHWNDGVVA